LETLPKRKRGRPPKDPNLIKTLQKRSNDDDDYAVGKSIKSTPVNVADLIGRRDADARAIAISSLYSVIPWPPRKCYNCDIVFSEQEKLSIHSPCIEKTVFYLDGGSIKCPFKGCELRVNSIQTAQSHLVLHCPPKYVCNVCQDKMFSEFEIAQHIVLKHTREVKDKMKESLSKTDK
jgi:hypothetical protein